MNDIFGDSLFEAMMHFASDLLVDDWQGTKYYLVFFLFFLFSIYQALNQAVTICAKTPRVSYLINGDLMVVSERKSLITYL